MWGSLSAFFILLLRLNQGAIVFVGPVSAVDVSIAPHLHLDANSVRAAELPNFGRSMKVHLPLGASIRANVSSEVPDMGAKWVVLGVRGISHHSSIPQIREGPLALTVSGEGGL